MMPRKFCNISNGRWFRSYNADRQTNREPNRQTQTLLKNTTLAVCEGL